jgi:hypothetical protein
MFCFWSGNLRQLGRLAVLSVCLISRLWVGKSRIIISCVHRDIRAKTFSLPLTTPIARVTRGRNSITLITPPAYSGDAMLSLSQLGAATLHRSPICIHADPDSHCTLLALHLPYRSYADCLLSLTPQIANYKLQTICFHSSNQHVGHQESSHIQRLPA